MRQFVIILLLTILTMTCHGQTLFYGGLKNSIWTSEEYFSTSKIKQEKEIGLTMLRVSMDSLKVNRSIWSFTDELRISHYDCVLKKDSTMVVCKFEVDKDTGRLKIMFDDNEVSEYGVGVVSTGSFALLMRKEKKNNDR
jgi:hypothetical protein